MTNSRAPRAGIGILAKYYSTSGTGSFYGGIYSETRSATETDMDNPIYKVYTVTRVTANVFTNDTTTDSSLAFRDDASDIGALDIGQTTGEYDSGVLSILIATGSKASFRITHGSNHTLAFMLYVETS